MELMSQPFTDIMAMPYGFFYKALQWKIKFEQDKNKLMEEKMSGKTGGKTLGADKLKV